MADHHIVNFFPLDHFDQGAHHTANLLPIHVVPYHLQIVVRRLALRTD